jgi:hypothetical protein
MRRPRNIRLFIAILIFSWFFLGFPQIWENLPIPPGIQEALAEDYDVTYSFTTQSQAAVGWVYDGPGSYDGLQTRDTRPYWCWTNTGSPSNGTGPPSGVPCVYTESSSPGAAGDVYIMTLAGTVDASAYGLYVTFNTCTQAQSAGTLYFEAYNGSTWVGIASWSGNTTTTFTSRGPYNFTAYANSDFKIRFRVVTGGTAYQNDFAIDEVRIYGNTKASNVTQTHYRWREDNGGETTGPAWKVQSYQGNIGAQTTVAVPITSVTSLNQAFILAPAGNMSVGRGSVSGNQNANEVLVRARFTALNQVTLARGSNANDSYYSFYVVENLTGGEINVKSGTSTFTTTDTQLDINVGSGIADYTKTAVFLTVSSGDAGRNNYNEARVRGYMTSNTNLTLRRTGGNSSVTVDWFVVEFIGSGWSVQQGDFSLTTGTQAAPQTQIISAVTLAQTFVFMNWSADTNGLDQTSAKVELFDATTLRFSRQDTTAGTVTCRYFVISHSALSVQRGSASAAGAAASVSQTITSVDTTQAFPMTFNDSNGTGAAFPRPYWRAWLSNSTTLYWDRAYTGQASNFPWQVINLSGFSSVGADFAADEDTKLVGLDKGSVRRLRFLVSNTGGQSSGAVTYQLQVAQTSTCGSGVYSAVPTDTSGHWQIVNSTYITDGQATSNISPGLTDPVGGTFVAGQSKDAGNTTGSITLGVSRFTEIEFSIMATSNAIYGVDYCFRLYNSAVGAPLDTYSAYATVRMAAPFSYRKAITIDRTKVSCGSMSNFPLLVSITNDGSLKTVANGGHIQSADGYDIIFRDTDGTTTLDHEIESYDGTAGTLIVWVRVPSLTNLDNKVIYMYYGNGGITTETQNPNGVWDSSFNAVYHLGNGSTLSAADSTTNANNGAISGATATTGIADGAASFNGSSYYITVPSSVLPSNNNFVLSAWFKTTSNGTIFGEQNSAIGSTPTSWDPALYVQTNGRLHGGIYTGTVPNLQSSGAVNNGAWHQAVLVVNGTGGSQTLYLDGALVGSATGTPEGPYSYVYIGTGYSNYWPNTNNGDYYFNGTIDEVRISSSATTPSACWLQTEYNNQSSPATFYTVGTEQATPPTVVDLLSLRARGDGSRVLVEWETAQEVDNVGFHLYRGETFSGSYMRVTERMIPGLGASVKGKAYSYVDNGVSRGSVYYYKLEDIDIHGGKTLHGPVCVDWDDDGIPDDWESAHGLDSTVDDSGSDLDGDGLSNLEEYDHGTDPLNQDSDADGIPDGQESGRLTETGETRTLTAGVEIIASDDRGVTLELRTESFESVVLDEGGVSYQRLRVPEYVHGYTDAVGKPELPVKGILIDLPAGKGGSLSIESVETKALSGYRIYPVPEKVVSGEGELVTVGEMFLIDDAAYGVNSFYPDVVARAGDTYDYREQKKLQVFFNPFSFNPVTGELVQYTKIRVRIAYVALAEEQPVVRSGVPLTPAPSGLARAVAWAPPVPASAYKMLVSEEGIYRLTSAWLTSQGVSVGDWSQVRVYNLGQEIPVYQGVDYIEFYGTPPTEEYSKYTRHNVYWLTTSGGSGAALRMGLIDGTPGTATVSSSHEFTVHDERDESYIMEAPGEDSLDRWCFFTFVLGEAFPAEDGGGLPQDFTVTLPGVTGIGSLRISMLGYYDTAHEVAVSVNGAVVGTYTWDGLTFLEAGADGVTFWSGDNTVTLKCKSGTDPIDPDVIVVDWIELSYPRDYVATNNLLKFSHDAGYRYQITGFTGDDVEAFDITSATDVKKVLHLVRAGDRVDMEPQGTTGTRTYMALSSSAVKEPAGLTQDRASTLSSASNGADYILITHRDLGWDVNGDPYPWLNSLTAHRQAQGLRVKVVDVEDIYDEFSYGIPSVQGIKEFLSYAYSNWVQPKPQYVLIVGDATNDPKNNECLDESGYRYVPSYLTFTEHLGETVTDDWYAKVSGSDAIPDLYIGRLPAATVGQAAAMVNKMIAYENSANSKTWEKNVLLVSDNQLDEYEALFERINDDAAAYISAGMNAPFKEYLGNYTNAGQLTGVIKDRINNDGTLVANYAGHGSVQIWANEHIFDSGDVGDLSNADRLPFIVSMTCLNGFFEYPEAYAFPSFAEALLRPGDRGAVAIFASTGMTEPEGQRVLDAALFEAIFKRDLRTLGPAISYAKQELMANGMEYEEVGNTFLLFGDPATVLKIPVPRMPSGVLLDGIDGTVRVSWVGALDCNGNPAAGYNVYRSVQPGGPYEKVNSTLITGTEYRDESARSGTWYYVVRSVDSDGDESPGTLEMSVTMGVRSVGGSGGAGGGGGCFISSAWK